MILASNYHPSECQASKSSAWAVHSMVGSEVSDADVMTDLACRIVRQEGFAQAGDQIAITAGMPFGRRVARIHYTWPRYGLQTPLPARRQYVFSGDGSYGACRRGSDCPCVPMNIQGQCVLPRNGAISGKITLRLNAQERLRLPPWLSK